MKNIFLFLPLILLILLVSCSTLSSNRTPSSVLATSESKLTPEPLNGRLFFDMNGSGLQDEATFVYDSSRLMDERQPLHPDLLTTLQAYVDANPDLRPGDLVTLDEPGLSGFTVCSGETCAVTNENGDFSLVVSGAQVPLSITDPNVGNPALAMRYINQWKGPVTVPAYTKEVDAETTAGLSAVTYCQGDTVTLVCKQDEVTLLVREQNLQDSEIIPIENQVLIQNQKNIHIGLMQGFLTLPVVRNSDAWLGSYVDTNYDLQMINNYSGDSTPCGDFNSPIHTSGTCNNHQGIDWMATDGSIIVTANSGKVIDVWEGDSGGAKQIRILHDLIAKKYSTDYGHNYVNLVSFDEKVYRSQIIALMGHTGVVVPHLHMGMFKLSTDANENGWVVDNIFYSDSYPKVVYGDGSIVPAVLDPFRNISDMESYSTWTSDNLPVYPGGGDA